VKITNLIKLSFLSSFLMSSTIAVAQDTTNSQILDQIDQYNQQGLDVNQNNNQGQVRSITELRDVSPGDWAYDALRNLVENYDCIEGYPNRTFRGDRPLTRYEFAAGLNACLDEIGMTQPEISREEFDQLKRLVNEFEAELATLGTRVDNLEGRVSFLEDHQFSTTTKLQGEVAFTLADAFGDNVNANTVFHDKVRLQLVTSFTGKDTLYTRLTAGNLENTFADELGTQEGRLAYDGYANNNLVIDRLHYYFPVGDKLKVHLMPSLGGHHFYADTLNPGLEVGGGANGALSRLGERNPIYRQGLGNNTSGVGLRFDLGKNFEVSTGYLAPRGSDPGTDAGFFNGDYSAMGQLVVKPSEDFKLGLTYIHSYNGDNFNVGTAIPEFDFGGTGTNFANLSGIGVANNPVSSNSYGVEAFWDVSPKFNLRAWGGFTNAILHGLGNAEIWNYSLVMAFPDLGKEGNLGALIVGTEPYMGGINIPGGIAGFTNDVPLHIEASYKYKVNNNISITPGVIVLMNRNQNDNNPTAVIGAVRTTFTF
jgi:hypothetical protein